MEREISTKTRKSDDLRGQVTDTQSITADMKSETQKLMQQMQENETRIMKLLAENVIIQTKLKPKTEPKSEIPKLDLATLLQNSFC